MSQVTQQNATAGHTGDDTAKILADAEALCRAVAGRDLDGIPLYLVPQSILPARCGSGDHCFAYTLGSLVHTNDPATKLGPFNRTAYSNPEVDKILQEAVRTLDDAKRRALFEKAMELSMSDRALIPIVVLQTVWAGRADKVTMKPRSDEDTLAYYINPAKGG